MGTGCMGPFRLLFSCDPGHTELVCGLLTMTVLTVTLPESHSMTGEPCEPSGDHG